MTDSARLAVVWATLAITVVRDFRGRVPYHVLADAVYSARYSMVQLLRGMSLAEQAHAADLAAALALFADRLNRLSPQGRIEAPEAKGGPHMPNAG